MKERKKSHQKSIVTNFMSGHLLLLLPDLMPSLLLALPSLSLTPLVRSTSPAPVRQAGRARQGVRLDRGRVQSAAGIALACRVYG